MIPRALFAFVLLIAGAVSVSASHAAATNPKAPSKAAISKAQKAKALQAQKAKQAKAKQLQKAKLAKAKADEANKKEWYAKDRDRGLDVASKYAPNAIANVRKNDYVAKGDTITTGGGKKGWRHYMDKYYSR